MESRVQTIAQQQAPPDDLRPWFVALHELTPYVVQVVDALPRWLPPALAGLLLIAVGATYEKRLRDARRLREALGRLH